jgi:hypothetical protein
VTDTTPVPVEQLSSVRSRMSWGGVFAGAVIALALYFLLTLIGSAIGLSINGHARASAVGAGAAIWAIVATVAALFVGGWVTSQLTVGESKAEAVMHGIILWGVLFAMLVWLLATGVRGGFNAMVGLAHVGSGAEDWEASARRAGVSQDTINDWRAKAGDAARNAERTAESPQNQEAAAEATARITWWAVLGTILSMAAAIAGAVAGSRSRFRLVLLAAPHPAAVYGPRPAPARY